ncbi:peptidoglycan DD-metalloendopeptidase family protein [Neobacillus dielmonensis]|uniref:peptidoglycan DD-metalloendopeptidase family protein n=1 Tax=Neobacillus dielmonensis TaxID=1347369 RepID=UPI0005A639B2|nr:peptidoglycan DD-metalloendopeptidase family protein [Neobacillus dielmonensis]
MRDYVKRFLIAILMAVCVSLLFLGGRHSQAAVLEDLKGVKDHWIWPADGIISDIYGTRQGKHKGIDIAGDINTPILSVDEGVVEKSYFSDTYGNVIFIKHPNQFVTVYAHLNKRNAAQGQRVKQGEVIGYMGQTGQATGVHLHFESHQLEWRYDKKFAINPEMVFGKAEVGETVRGGKTSAGDVVEVSLQLQAQMEHKTQSPNAQPLVNQYVVEPGDTLYSISRKSNTTISKIKELNHLATDIIKPAQVLILR